MYDLHPKVTIDLFNAAPGTTLPPHVHGGTMPANIDFIEASTKPSHVNFLSCDFQLTPVQGSLHGEGHNFTVQGGHARCDDNPNPLRVV